MLALSDLQTRLLARVDEDPANPAYYTAAEAAAALNWAQRLFALLTLCLETVRPFRLTPNVRFYHMLQIWPDWIAPLRVRYAADVSAGVDELFGPQPYGSGGGEFGQQATPGLSAPAVPWLRPAKISDFSARDEYWPAAPGMPKYYAAPGRELLAFERATTLAGVPLTITYARSPRAMVNPADTPEIPTADQPALVDAAQFLLRLKEGGLELAKASANLSRFFDAAKARARQVRLRSLAQRYDAAPFELERYDLSRLLAARQDLAPHKGDAKWPPT